MIRKPAAYVEINAGRSPSALIHGKARQAVMKAHETLGISEDRISGTATADWGWNGGTLAYGIYNDPSGAPLGR